PYALPRFFAIAFAKLHNILAMSEIVLWTWTNSPGVIAILTGQQLTEGGGAYVWSSRGRGETVREEGNNIL
ncbi:MAG: hypothetical protein ACXWMV_12230, partial [Syntrophales bacterium]